MTGDAARERILSRVREALVDRDRIAHPGELDREAGPPAPAGDEGAGRQRIDAFAGRFRAAGGEVVMLRDGGAAEEWLQAFSTAFEHAAVAETVGAPYRPALPPAPPEEADLGVSRAFAAAAQTGSLLLDSGEGRRLQLLPPVHLVWLEADAIHSTLGEALDSLGDDLPAAIGLHSGPSRSADIGGIVVTGVHGPGRVVAAILE